MEIDPCMRHQLKQTQLSLQMKASLAKYLDLGGKNKSKDFLKKTKWIEQLGVGEEKFIETLEKAKKAHLIHPQKLHYSIYGNPILIGITTLNSKDHKAIRETGLEKGMKSTAVFWESKGLFVDERA